MKTPEEILRSEFGNADSIPTESAIRVMKEFGRQAWIACAHEIYSGTYISDEIVTQLIKRAEESAYNEWMRDLYLNQ